MNTLAKSDILNLSVPERILLVEDIWDSVVEVPNAVPLTEEQKAELDRRLDAYHANSPEGAPWGVVKEYRAIPRSQSPSESNRAKRGYP